MWQNSTSEPALENRAPRFCVGEEQNSLVTLIPVMLRTPLPEDTQPSPWHPCALGWHAEGPQGYTWVLCGCLGGIS